MPGSSRKAKRGLAAEPASVIRHVRSKAGRTRCALYGSTISSAHMQGSRSAILHMRFQDSSKAAPTMLQFCGVVTVRFAAIGR